jgi:uncharacterized membrane protein
MMGVFDLLTLIALGIGYIVLYFAKREEKIWRFSGLLVGGMIIGLATFYLVINSLLPKQLNCRHCKGGCQGKMMAMPQEQAPK